LIRENAQKQESEEQTQKEITEQGPSSTPNA
jgi:hypothetical protein